MKHYLDLVPISAKVHRKQSRMSIFCIVLAVFLVTTIFGMADMFVRSQIIKTQAETGNWHIALFLLLNLQVILINSNNAKKECGSLRYYSEWDRNIDFAYGRTTVLPHTGSYAALALLPGRYRKKSPHNRKVIHMGSL